MKNRKHRRRHSIYWPCLILIAGIIILVAVDVIFRQTSDSTPPVITYPAEIVEYTPGSDYAGLLANVTAQDPEDGDVSDTVRVRTVNINSDMSEAVVTYVAKDQANNIGMVKRIVAITPADTATDAVAVPPVATEGVS